MQLVKTKPVGVCEGSCLEVLQGEIARNFSAETVERMGFDIGYRFMTRFSNNGPAPLKRTDLDVFKFVCKEVWIDLYGKKVDRLQTNHKGTFMCTDLQFPPLQRMSKSATAEIEKHLAVHKGMLCGALRNLGVHVTDLQMQVLSGGTGCCFTFKTLSTTAA